MLRAFVRAFLVYNSLAAVVAAAEPAVTVDSVVDGDTVRLSDGRVCRLIDIDAPETRHARCAPERRAARQATSRLGELVQRGATVEVIAGRDCKHGRACCRMMFRGEDVGAVLIRDGLAVSWPGGRGRRPKDWCRGASD